MSEHRGKTGSLPVGDGRSKESASSSSRITLTDVQATCLMTAYLRHLETQRDKITSSDGPKSLIHDPFAAILLEKLAPPGFIDRFHNNPGLDTFIHHLATRTRTIDDFLLDPPALPEQPAHQRQIVNLGAGMCTRPYRLGTRMPQSTTFYEVENDLNLLQAKRQVLRDQTPQSDRVVAVIDVEGDVCDMESLLESLQTAGFDPTIPTDWIAEGLLEYLPPENRWKIFQHTRRVSCPGSRLMVYWGDPYARDYFRDILKFLPPLHEDVFHKTRALEEMKKAGWGANVTVFGDPESYAKYQRSINLPWYILCAEPSSSTSAACLNTS